MFIRPHKRFKNGKWHTYYSVVESRRAANGVTGRVKTGQLLISLYSSLASLLANRFLNHLLALYAGHG
ncbi:MAG: hypothetical protein HKL96_03895 [Phycisphaerales bacterium]|nr:hypothetical protein [Phycisphaerales bacterium]